MSKKIEKTWKEFSDVNYVSQQPGISKGFRVRQAPRLDTDPSLNSQPWYQGSHFSSVDPSVIAIPHNKKRY